MAGEINLTFMVLNLISACITGILAFFFIKMDRFLRHIPLGNIAVGFCILAASFALGAVHGALAYFDLVPRARLLLIATLSLQTLAFAFIAAGYALWKHEEKSNKLTILLVSFLMLVIFVVVLYVFVPPVFSPPDFTTLRQYFHGANLILLSYVGAKAFGNFVQRPDVRSILVPAGFMFLAVGQYSLFIWSLDGGLTSVVSSYVCRIIGLILLLRVVLMQREKVAHD